MLFTVKKLTMISAGIVNDSLVFDSITNVTKDLLNYNYRQKSSHIKFKSII